MKNMRYLESRATSVRLFTRSRFDHAVMATVLAIMTATSAEAANQIGAAPSARQSCRVDTDYEGPPRRQVPAEVWQRDFTRRIDGSLPTAYTKALQAVVDDLTARAPAVSVAVAIPGMGRWSVSKGVSRTEPRTPLPPNVRFQVASTTKTLTAATILQLEAEGKLRVSRRIDEWFKEAPNAEIITVDQLLRHTSGLVSFNALPSWTLDYRKPREAIALATGQPPLFCPGTSFAYSNTGYAMLGVIIEDLDNRPLWESFRERFVRPLGLTHTSLRHPGDDPPVASGHLRGKPLEVPDHYATPFAAGGLASTAEDLVTFWHALLSGTLVSSATVRAMFTDLVPMAEDRQMYYGRGVQLYDIPQGPGLMLGHSGGITGFTSVVAYVSADDMYVAVVFNDQNVPAEAGLWAVVRAVREVRRTRQ